MWGARLSAESSGFLNDTRFFGGVGPVGRLLLGVVSMNPFKILRSFK